MRQIASVAWCENEPNPVCPGLFYAVPAQDGRLFRIRVPGGILTLDQARVLAQFAEELGQGELQITNRANIQIRTPQPEIPAEMLSRLQQVGLAAAPNVDHLRNLMGSPTAGIDPAARIDVRPLIQTLDHQISNRPDLAGLPAKFSVGVDGGEAASVRHRSNEIWLVADRSSATAGFQVLLSAAQGLEINTGLWVKPAESAAVVMAIAAAYLELATAHRPPQGKQPRLKKILETIGVAEFLNQVKLKLKQSGLSEVMQSDWCYQASVKADAYHHLGVHAQMQAGLSYIGLNLKLGNLSAVQLAQIADRVESAGSTTLRLTPWQTLLIPDLPTDQLPVIQQQLAAIGFSWQPEVWTALVACAGSPGCAAAATQTQQHAQAIAAALASESFKQPINIHLTGCAKSCAQQHYSDIALLGQQTADQQEVYDLFVAGNESRFGRLLYSNIPASQVSHVVERLIHNYHQQTHASFRNFVEQHSVSELQQLFSHVSES